MATDRPNILLITTDQQRYDASGSGGPSFLRTPHYDHLAREGITYSRAYADCPLCVPSRVSIMTGKTVAAHGMLGNGNSSRVMGRDETLPAQLRRLGYQTAAVGKMHFTPERNRHGFDEMILPADYYRWIDRAGFPFKPMHHGLGQNELYPSMATVPEALTLTSWTAEQCVEYIRERRDPTAPFFLWCSFSKPHPPLDPPEPYYSMYRDCPIPEPIHGDWSSDEAAPQAFVRHRQRYSFDLIPPEVQKAARAAYYGLITQCDYNMGRVFAALQDLGMFNDTLVLYTSDHGEYLGDHHTGAKTFFHEPAAHVPMVLRLPQSWEDRRAGTTVESPTALADVLPTLVRAAGGKPDEGADGLDLTAIARGEAPPREYLEAMIADGGESVPQYAAITDGRWKYIWYSEGGTEQLFDLQTDPKELRNMAGSGQHGDQLTRLRDQVIRRQQERNSPLVENGRLVARPVEEDSVTDRRNRSWPGYHTEHYDKDVRH